MGINIFIRTLPYVLMRALVYALFSVGVLVFLGILFLLGLLFNAVFPGSAVPVIILAVIAVSGIFGLIRLAQRYVLYLVKIGHVAVITELVTVGELPAGTNQYSYGKDQVVSHFGSASALFVVDQLVSAAVRQIMNWLSAAAGCANQVPGLNALIGIIKAVLQIAADYIDEAVMSYILQHKDQDIWRAAADGLVLYAQSWKKLLLTAAVLALIIAVLGIAIFLLVALPFFGLAQTQPEASRPLYYVVGFVLAIIVSGIFKALVVDPMATVGMVVSYNQAIQGQTPSIDTGAQIASVSSKFRQIQGRVGTGTDTKPLDAAMLSGQ
ncbi:MAG: hypothetical protein ACYC6L_11960 [Anaerolineae bacterium]